MPRPLSVTESQLPGFQLDLDKRRVAGHSLVHGVVDHLREEVVEGLLVRAPDIHAGAPADRFEPFQHLDRRAS